MYSRIERGERSVRKEQIPIIAEALNADSEELLKLWLADQMSTLMDGESNVFNEVVDIVKKGSQEMYRKTKKYTFIDLFAGCGGLSEGFLQTGKYEGLAHVEWESPMVNTLRHRLVDKWGHSEIDAMNRVIKFDVQKTEELFHGNWSEE